MYQLCACYTKRIHVSIKTTSLNHHEVFVMPMKAQREKQNYQ